MVMDAPPQPEAGLGTDPPNEAVLSSGNQPNATTDHSSTVPAKASDVKVQHHALDVPYRPSRARSPDAHSIISAEDFSEMRLYDAEPRHPNTASSTIGDYANDDKSHHSWKSKAKSYLRAVWIRNKGLFLVILAQVCVAIMSGATRLLEQDTAEAKGMNPFQILFFRMAVTIVLGMSYMWYTNVEHFPLGQPAVRRLLVARGFGGFIGVFCAYYSLQYLSVSDAIVLTFLAPSLTSYVCSKLLAQPFTRAEQVGAVVSLVGVVLIARPGFLFGARADALPDDSAAAGPASALVRRVPVVVTAAQRLSGVAVALLGVVGAVTAFTTIRWIGKRAHPLISVNYFAAVCLLISTVALLLPGSGGFFPQTTLKGWGLLTMLGLAGFANQFLLTSGLHYENSSRATNMMYSSMVFAMAIDRVIWGVVPTALSLVGSVLIVASGIVTALQREKVDSKESGGIEMQNAAGVRDGPSTTEEGEGLLASTDEQDLAERGHGLRRSGELDR